MRHFQKSIAPLAPETPASNAITVPTTVATPAVVKTEAPVIAPATGPAPVPELKEQVAPPVALVPLVPPVAPVPLANSVPVSSIAPVAREMSEPKPVVKAEPRNGLDKVDVPHYIDPIERSLASLERSLKADVPMNAGVSESESSMRLEEEFSLPKQPLMPDAHSLMAQLGGLTDMTHVPDQIKSEMYPSHNGFLEKTMHHDRDVLRPDLNTNIPGMASVPPVSSIFDPLPPASHTVIAQSHHSAPNSSCLITPANKKEEINKPLLTPKPIEDLMGVPNMTNNISDRAKYEMEQKKMEDVKNSNFVQAFKLKQEQNLKNASSWSSLAQAGSPQQPPTVNPTHQVKQKPVMDSFQVSLFNLFRFITGCSQSVYLFLGSFYIYTCIYCTSISGL